ncbi:MAG: nucleotidyltransferase domain-containing protein [Clostridiales bacterium]|nr:nucleotidyltransferase domain-containing protein [Clostridiales bacterium]
MLGRRKESMRETGIKPIVIEEICDFARKYNVKKVILFGSRARGNFKEKSDIDLAVQGGDFIRFMLDVNEETSTLLSFDIINLDEEIMSELRKSIEKEGKVIYEEV